MESSEVLAAKLLELMGGKKNTTSVTYYATRLRPQSEDRSLVSAGAIGELDGATGLVNKDSGLQVIIGMSVKDIYKAFVKVWDSERLEWEGLVGKEEASPKRHEWFNKFTTLVVSISSPLLPLLAGSGLPRGLTILMSELRWSSTSSTTSLTLASMVTSVFYFLPLLTATTAAKRLQTSLYIAVAVMGALIMPDFLALVQGDGGNGVEFLGISIPIFDYTSQIIPTVIMTWLQSQMRHFMTKKIPNSLRMTIVPTVLLLVLVSVTADVIGPIGNYTSIGVVRTAIWLANINQVITRAVIGGVQDVLIMFRVYWVPSTMTITPDITKGGCSPFVAYGTNANFGTAGITFVIFLRSENKKLKDFSLTAITSVMLSGIVKSVIYGLGIKFRTPLIAGCMGAVLDGVPMRLFRVAGNAFIFGGLATTPALAEITLWTYIVSLTISFIDGIVPAFVFGIKDPEAQMISKEQRKEEKSMELNKKIESILGLSVIDDAMGATTEDLTFGQIREMLTAPMATFQKSGETTFASGNEAGEIIDGLLQIYMLSGATLNNKGRIARDIVIETMLEWPDIPKYLNRLTGPITRSAVEVYKNPSMEMKPPPSAVTVDYVPKVTNGAVIKITSAGILYPGNPKAAIDDVIVVAQVTCDSSLAVSRAYTIATATSVLLTEKTTIEEVISAGVHGAIRGETKARNVSRVVAGAGVVERVKLALQIAEGTGSKGEKLLELSQIIGSGLYTSGVAPCVFGIAALSKDSALQAIIDAVNIGYDTDTTTMIVGTMVGAFVDFGDKDFLDLYDKIQKASKIDLIILADELAIATRAGQYL